LPDLALCDFPLFPKLKMKLNRWHFETVSDIQRESQAALGSVKENDFHSVFEAWKKWWDRCMHFQVDYFEGDAAKIKLGQHFFFDLVRELSGTPCIKSFSEFSWLKQTLDLLLH
jgi:hypothetical protein